MNEKAGEMFHDKTVLVTGASSGIGAALARRFAAAKARVVLVARRADRLSELANECGSAASTIAADLTDPDAPDRILGEIDGQVDVLVNNAGVGEYGRFHEQDLDTLHRMMQLNMASLVHLSHRVAEPMLARGSGHIMNIASTAAYQPTPFMAVYGATKAFVLSFSMSLWAEFRPRGVGVTCICPGPVTTEFFDRGGYQTRKSAFTRTAHTSEQVADMAFDCLSRRRSAFVPGLINKTGAIIQRFVPLRTATRLSGRILRPKK